MREGAPTLRVDDLVVRYGGYVAVDGVSFRADPDGLTALVGPSGCGKTSLLRTIAGFETPASGSITIGERTVAGPGTWVPPEHRAVGMVFQQGALFPHLTVSRNVAFGVAGEPDAEERARRALERVGLAELGHRYPDQLSGGQQQRVALARALAPAPAIVLLDEPFANLDAALRQQVRDEVCAILRDSGTTAMIVTHDQEEALSVADRVAVMMRGRLLQVGEPEEIYRRPDSVDVAEFIGDGQLVECEVENGRLHSEVGTATCDLRDGRAQLLVRPEDLTISADPGSTGVPGEVRERRYFGHDQISRVRLPSGRSVQVRLSGREALPVGSAVRLRLRSKRYSVFVDDACAEATVEPSA